MAKRKLSEARMAELYEAYDQWQKFSAESETADELAARFGIGRATLYEYLDRRDAERRDARHAEGDTSADNGVSVPELRATVRYLTEELVSLRIQNKTLEDRLERVESRLPETA